MVRAEFDKPDSMHPSCLILTVQAAAEVKVGGYSLGTLCAPQYQLSIG